MLAPFAILFVAIGVEVAATAALPRTQGFHDPLWSLAVVAGYALSIWLLSIVVRNLQVSVAYAIWSGVGTAAVAVVGVLTLGESLDLTKALALALIIVGVIVLNMQATAH